ncbi:DsbA family protein [Haliangium sp.]|uniref:DsbA family protein n=1 Tax=Haliangium sp. TaxID=2663208 RepID=UPI003D0FFE98
MSATAPRLVRVLQPYAAMALSGPTRERLSARVHDLARRVRARPHTLDVFVALDDPYSYLLAQALPALRRRFDVEVSWHPIGAPAGDDSPEREHQRRYACVDAGRLAELYQLDFPEQPTPLTGAHAALATRALAAAVAERAPAEYIVELCGAYWRGDPRALGAVAERLPALAPAEADAVLTKGRRALERRGHYAPGTIHYGGAWYWGVDRLDHLERHLIAAGAARSADVGVEFDRQVRGFAGGPAGSAAPDQPIVLYLSVRSPYSYIALERTSALAAHYGAALDLRPVLPMVMRGLAVPVAKKFYILRDAAREARKLGIPLGRVCDPVGRGTERIYALCDHAAAHGKHADFLRSAARGVWAEGIDAATDAGLSRLVERAGLSWAEARRHLDDESWREWAERHRQELYALGLWGVPCLRYHDTAVWGQDRLWVIEREIRARAAESPG